MKLGARENKKGKIEFFHFCHVEGVGCDLEAENFNKKVCAHDMKQYVDLSYALRWIASQSVTCTPPFIHLAIIIIKKQEDDDKANVALASVAGTLVAFLRERKLMEHLAFSFDL